MSLPRPTMVMIGSRRSACSEVVRWSGLPRDVYCPEISTKSALFPRFGHKGNRSDHRALIVVRPRNGGVDAQDAIPVYGQGGCGVNSRRRIHPSCIAKSFVRPHGSQRISAGIIGERAFPRVSNRPVGNNRVVQWGSAIAHRPYRCLTDRDDSRPFT